MKEIFTSIEIKAPAVVVWEALTNKSSYAKWNNFIIQAIGDYKVGSKVKIMMKAPQVKDIEYEPEITVFLPLRELSWKGNLFTGFEGTHSFQLKSSGGATKLIHQANFKGLMTSFIWGGFGYNFTIAMEEMNSDLKKYVEKNLVSH